MDLIGERRLLALISGLTPGSAWWSSFRVDAKPKPIEGAAAETFLSSIASA